MTSQSHQQRDYWHRHCRCSAAREDPQRQRPLIVRLLVVTFGVLTSCLIGVVFAARIRATPTKIDPPAFLLPGSDLAIQSHCEALSSCHESPNGYRDYIIYDGRKVYLVFDRQNQMVVHTTMSVDTYTLGDLIATWGPPTGLAHYGHIVDVYWGTRDAYLHACSLQPDTRVEFIEYDLEPRQGSAWRGFTGDSKPCPGSLYSP
jgi:hypothetical protein